MNPLRPPSALALTALLASLTGSARADLVIEEVVDATLDAGQPKWVEILNTGPECVFLGDYQLCFYANGAVVATGCNVLAAEFLAPGASYVLAYELASNKGCDPNGLVTCFEYVYGFPPDQNSGAFINGDDAIVLRDAVTCVVLDAYGEIGVDGTGTAWEYKDSWARRSNLVATPVFDPADWVFGGPGALVGSAEAGILASTSPGTYVSCVPPFISYCTAGTSANGCIATISAAGTPSATLTSGFFLNASGADGNRSGGFFFGTSGPQASPWGGTGFMCVAPPRLRAGLLAGSGTIGACDGAFGMDLNALWCPGCPSPGKNPGPGVVCYSQLWFRDPFSTTGQTTTLSNAMQFTVEP